MERVGEKESRRVRGDQRFCPGTQRGRERGRSLDSERVSERRGEGGRGGRIQQESECSS